MLRNQVKSARCSRIETIARLLTLIAVVSACGNELASKASNKPDAGVTPSGGSGQTAGGGAAGKSSTGGGGNSSLTDAAPPLTDAAPNPDASLPDAAPDSGSEPDAGLPPIRMLAIGQLTANGQPEIHAPFVKAATVWLDNLAQHSNLVVTHVESPNALTDDELTHYDLIFQLNYVPFGWNTTAQAAFQKYISEGRGGWVGLHHASLYGPEVTPSSETPWTWYYDFIGQINYENYIASFASATVHVEESAHPIFKGVPATFVVTTDEWYVWDKSPRPHVHVLATVDESSYSPPSDIKMGGDHPVVWSNEAYKAKNLYIFVGHHPNLFQNTAYMTLLQNAIFWAGTKAK